MAGESSLIIDPESPPLEKFLPVPLLMNLMPIIIWAYQTLESKQVSIKPYVNQAN